MPDDDHQALDRGDRLIAVGAVMALGVSVVLSMSLLIRPDVGFNLLNMATILPTSAAALLAFFRSRNVLALIIANAVLIAAAFPALLSGVGLLYLPSLVLFILGTTWRIRHRRGNR